LLLCALACLSCSGDLKKHEAKHERRAARAQQSGGALAGGAGAGAAAGGGELDAPPPLPDAEAGGAGGEPPLRAAEATPLRGELRTWAPGEPIPPGCALVRKNGNGPRCARRACCCGARPAPRQRVARGVRA
jgi:hypothetical protein